MEQEYIFLRESKKFLAQIKVGLINFKIPINDAVKKFEEFKSFVIETIKEYNINEFYCNIGNKGVKYENNDYGGDFGIVDVFKKGDFGIIHNGVEFERDKIGERLKNILEAERIQNILNDLSLGVEFLKNKNDVWKKIKQKLNNNSFRGTKYIEENTQRVNCFLKEFFGEEIEEKDIKQNKISKVYEKENVRIAISKNSYFSFLNIIVATPSSNVYNYLDEGRFIIWNYNSKIILDGDTEKDVLDSLQRNKLGNFEEGEYLSKDRVNQLVRKDINRKKIEKIKDDKKRNLNLEIEKRLKKNGKITLNGITRYKNGLFEYGGQKIGFKGYKVLNVGFEVKNFNSIFETIISNYLYYSRKYLTHALYCGSFKINKVETKNDRWYIEGIRINEAERKEVLLRALCYQNKKQYKEFLKEVSKCSIKIHNAISKGLKYNFGNKYYDEKEFSKVNLVRKKNYNYIVFKKRNYRIKNINSLINMECWTYKDLDVNAVAENLEKNSQLSYDLAIEVLKDGLADYKLSVKRAEELLKETIKKLKISEIEIDTDEFSGKGYLVKGKSGEKYFVSKNLKVWKYPNMKYICIINKGRVDVNNVDLLIARLYACHNDSVMANNGLITTLIKN